MAGHTLKIKRARVLLFCAAAALAGCHKDDGPVPAPTPAPQLAAKAPVVKKGPSAAEQTAGMVEASSQGKSQVPLQLKFELASRPKVGQPLEINVALISHIDATQASVKVSGADGLTVASDSTQYEVPSLEADSVYRRTLSVTPTAEGVLILGVSVALKHEEITDLSAFSIPIIAER